MSYLGDPRVRVVFNEKNSGSTFKQWNKGARMALGKYIWFAESDDYADERLLEKLVARLDAEPKSVLCYCRSWQVSSTGKLNGFQDSYLPDLGTQKWSSDFQSDGIEECRRCLVHCNTVLSASSVVFRKDVYWRVGGADETLVLCGDWKMWAAMALSGGEISYLGEALNYYRFHAASVSERSMRDGIWAKEALEVVRFIVGRVGIRKDERAKLFGELFDLWGTAVLTRKVPLSRRGAILLNALTLDHKALFRLLPEAVKVLRMTIARRLRSLRG